MDSDRSDSQSMARMQKLDRLIHEPARLMIVSILYVVERADFLFLQRQTELTQGNLSSHMNKLEAAGYIEVAKGFAGKRPRTMLRLTEAGRVAFENYRRTMDEVLNEPPTDDGHSTGCGIELTGRTKE